VSAPASTTPTAPYPVGRPRRLNSHAAVLLVLWLASGVYLYLRADRGWIPHDEGTLAQAAERVLEGQLPHRDFDDTYTGGLAMLHALAFKLFGIRLLSIRWMLLIFSLLFIPALYRIAARAAPPIVAGLATATGVALSLPNYFVPLPSYYNLFFATFGTLALLRHIETDRRRWLFAAGLCGGLSFIIKPIALFYVAAVLLVLVYREQAGAASAADRPSTRGFSVLVTAGLLTFAGLLLQLVLRRPAAMELLQFGVPGLALTALLIANEWRTRRGNEPPRWRRLAHMCLPFVAGVVVPVAIFVMPYAMTSSLPSLVHGVFILPQRRLAESAYPLPGPTTLAWSIPLVILFATGFVARPRRTTQWLLAVPTALILAVIVCNADQDRVYRAIFLTLRPVVILVTLAACLILGLPVLTRRLSEIRRQQVMLVAAMAAMVSLVQFPYAFGLYFCYVAPLVVLAALYVAWGAGPTHVCVLCFYLAFAVVWLNRGYVRHFGEFYRYVEESTPMELPRSGLRVRASSAGNYHDLIELIVSETPAGDYIYAAPDAPEIYFLSARRNPTRTFFDFLDTDFDSNPSGRAGRIMALLDEHDVRLVVIKQQAEFSELQEALRLRLLERYEILAANELFVVLGRGGDPHPAR